MLVFSVIQQEPAADEETAVERSGVTDHLVTSEPPVSRLHVTFDELLSEPSVTSQQQNTDPMTSEQHDADMPTSHSYPAGPVTPTVSTDSVNSADTATGDVRSDVRAVTSPLRHPAGKFMKNCY